MNWLNPAVLGFAVRSKLVDLGESARLCARLVVLLGVTLRRFRLVIDQLFLLGNRSLSIITV